MDKKQTDRYFEEWLRAYSDHLHMVRQGHSGHVGLGQHAEPKPPAAAKKNQANHTQRKHNDT